MGPFVMPTVARRLRVVGAAIVLLVLVTAPFERWFLVRRSNAMQERILDVRRSASARYPEDWQRDSMAVREVASLEYHRAHVRERLVKQLTTESWTVRLLVIGAVIWATGALPRSREQGAGSRTSA
jgi:hypothetical protein